MKITFLGTTAHNPDTGNATSIVIQPKNSDEYFLIDTGWGGYILRELIECSYDPKKLGAVFISHIHADHSLGLPSLYFRIANITGKKYTDQKMFDVLTSANIWEMLLTIIHYTIGIEKDSVRKNLNFRNIEKEEIKNICGIDQLEFFPTEHTKRKPGRLPLESYGIVIYAEGKKIVYPGDTIALDLTIEKTKGADLLIHEVFCPDDEERAQKSGHTTAAQAGQIAQKAGVKKLILTHFVAEFLDQKEEMKKAAQRYFNGEIVLSKDYMSLEV